MYEVVLELVKLDSEEETKEEEEVEFEELTGDPDVTDPVGMGGSQMPVP